MRDYYGLEYNPSNTCSADITGDPQLGTLANNGGPTQTIAVGAGSAAITTNAGAIAACIAPVYNPTGNTSTGYPGGAGGVDQRGFARSGSRCTVGAYEAITPLTLGPATLSDAGLNGPYNRRVTASGGTGPYTYAVTMGSLPPGLTLNASTGTFSGMPTQAGSYSFTITVTDSAMVTTSQMYTLNVSAPLVQPAPGNHPAVATVVTVPNATPAPRPVVPTLPPPAPTPLPQPVGH